MKKILSVLLAFLFLFSFPLELFAEEGNGISWYISKTEKNTAPTLPRELSLINGHKAVYLDPEPDKKVVYLTFDFGYENGNVEKVRQVLSEKNVKAAFFVVEHSVASSVPLISRLQADGHLICNHTANHTDMSKITDKAEFVRELQRLEEQYAVLTGCEMSKFYRPPEGRFSEENLRYADELGFTTVFWSVAYADWDNEKQPDPDKALATLLSRTHNGAIVLLHPTSSTNAAILAQYIDALRAEGYTFGTLDEI